MFIQMHELSSGSIFSPKTWPFDLKWLPQPAYLVGGAVRDGLLGRKSEYLDLDFVLMERAVKTARIIANHYKAGFVLLDAERQIARVVFQDATVDLAQAEGESLLEDLQRRDFTINAIAYDPVTDAVIDPHKGQADLQLRRLRMISADNLRDDPLRLLRGYRQAAQLGFNLASDTQSVIRQLAPLLSQVAVERVQTELGYLLHHSGGTAWVQQAIKDGLISSWFPDAQQRFSSFSQIDHAATECAQYWPELAVELSASVRPTIKTSLLALAKLADLLTPDPKIAESQLTQLKYSKAEIRGAIALLRCLPAVLQTPPLQLSLRQQYFLFQESAKLFPAVVVMALAAGVAANSLSGLIERYLTSDDPVAHPTLLITGNELMSQLNLRPSPKIGQLLMKIQLAQVEGQISTPQEAVQFAAQSLEEQV